MSVFKSGYQPGSNYPADKHDSLLRRGMLGRCDSTGVVFSIGHVELLDRYADCTGFRCPGCKQRHDDRPAWHGPAERRMGYTQLREPDLRVDREGRWISL